MAPHLPCSACGVCRRPWARGSRCSCGRRRRRNGVAAVTVWLRCKGKVRVVQAPAPCARTPPACAACARAELFRRRQRLRALSTRRGLDVSAPCPTVQVLWVGASRPEPVGGGWSQRRTPGAAPHLRCATAAAARAPSGASKSPGSQSPPGTPGGVRRLRRPRLRAHSCRVQKAVHQRSVLRAVKCGFPRRVSVARAPGACARSRRWLTRRAADAAGEAPLLSPPSPPCRPAAGEGRAASDTQGGSVKDSHTLCGLTVTASGCSRAAWRTSPCGVSSACVRLRSHPWPWSARPMDA